MKNNIIYLSIAVLICLVSVKAQPPTTFVTYPSALKLHDAYGWAVASDGKYAVVSAAQSDDIMINDGAVWIYKVNGKNIENPVKVAAPRNQTAGYFGNDVAIEGNNLLIGAYGMNENGGGAGLVYYYKHDGTSWKFMQQLGPTDARMGDKFGHCIALSNGVAVIGSPGSNNSLHQGKAYVFRLNSSEKWIQEAALTMPQKASVYPAFGWDVDIDNNVVAVSALYASGSKPQSGKVFLYRYTNTKWSMEAELSPGISNTLDLFGCSISLSAGMLAVGASNHAGIGQAGKNTGAVFLFGKPAGKWVEQTRLTGDEGSNQHDHFGCAVSLDQHMLAVGANQDDFIGKNTGAVYVFSFTGNSWGQENKFIGSVSHDHDNYGSAVTIFGTNMLVGSQLGEQDTTKKDHGLVYYYTRVDQPLVYNDVMETHPTIGAGVETTFYPNPFSTNATLVVITKQEVEAISVYDMNGRFVGYPLPVKKEPGIYTYEVSANLPAGMYIVNIKLSNTSRNLLIQKE